MALVTITPSGRASLMVAALQRTLPSDTALQGRPGANGAFFEFDRCKRSTFD
jgi:hypothetical protein